MSATSKQLAQQFPELKAVRLAAARLNQTKARFAFYKYLRVVYRAVWHWGLSKRRKTTTLAALTGRQGQVGLHAFRAIIDATYPSLEAKMASRWTRALEFAFLRDIAPSQLLDFFKQSGGVANCARHAANTDPKKIRQEPYEFRVDR
jgi:hypothetical protein